MKTIKIVLLGLLFSSLAGCLTTGANNTTESAAETKEIQETEAEVEKSASAKIIDGSNAAPGSLFSKLSLGMGSTQIYDTIGPPTDRKSYATAKNWLPWYFGPDTHRQEYNYQGEGRLTMGGNGRLIAITVNPDEDGYY